MIESAFKIKYTLVAKCNTYRGETMPHSGVCRGHPDIHTQLRICRCVIKIYQTNLFWESGMFCFSVITDHDAIIWYVWQWKIFKLNIVEHATNFWLSILDVWRGLIGLHTKYLSLLRTDAGHRDEGLPCWSATQQEKINWRLVKSRINFLTPWTVSI